MRVLRTGSNYMKADMGKVITPIKVANWDDLALQAVGARSEPPRTVETDALVDTGAVNSI